MHDMHLISRNKKLLIPGFSMAIMGKNITGRFLCLYKSKCNLRNENGSRRASMKGYELESKRHGEGENEKVEEGKEDEKGKNDLHPSMGRHKSSLGGNFLCSAGSEMIYVLRYCCFSSTVSFPELPCCSR